MRILFSGIVSVLIFTPLIFLGTSGCAPTEKNIDRSTAHNYRVGHPEVKARATSFFDGDGNPVIDLAIELPLGSLIFHQRDEYPEAGVEITTYIRHADREDEILDRASDERKIVRKDVNKTSHFYERRLKTDPGRYILEIQVKDLSSDKITRSRVHVTVPNPESSVASTSDIRMTLPGDMDERVISSYLIPAASDSISFEFYVSRAMDEHPVEVKMELLRFRSDTEPPRSIAMMPVPAGSMAYRGIDYGEREVIQSQSRTLDTETGSILVDYTLELPKAGAYRFEVTIETKDESGENIKSTRHRDFAVVNRNHPHVKTTREMVEPLVYLMTTREFRRITSIESPDSLRRAFDRFWLSNIGDHNKARDVIELYYTRVEEANRQFSNFKEGWKTDMGMVYILLGPPVYVENHIDSFVWFYSYNRNDPRTIFHFERARVHSASFPFTHYILHRHRFYQQIEYQIIQNWLSGDVLQRNIF